MNVESGTSSNAGAAMNIANLIICLMYSRRIPLGHNQYSHDRMAKRQDSVALVNPSSSVKSSSIVGGTIGFGRQQPMIFFQNAWLSGFTALHRPSSFASYSGSNDKCSHGSNSQYENDNFHPSIGLLLLIKLLLGVFTAFSFFLLTFIEPASMHRRAKGKNGQKC
jgi:hypothetical protein